MTASLAGRTVWASSRQRSGHDATIRRPLVLLTAAAAIIGSAVVPASAASPGAAKQSLTFGTCSKGSKVSMPLGTADPGKTDAGFEIGHSPAGAAWKVTLHDNVAYFTGIRTARGGTFSVDRVLRNLPGTDTFSGRATNVKSGEVCTVTAHI